MGLCKCPAKKITRQFCFEHKVNVCEYCMVDKHSKCIIQPYLQWLDDSTYKPICNLCQKNLALDECIRLLCCHIFHWKCLNDYASNLPSNTAPGGYTCPDCNNPIFPVSEHSTPLANHLRKVLSTVQWTRAGLGLPFIETRSPINGSNNATQKIQIIPEKIDKSYTVPISLNHLNHHMEDSYTNVRKFHEINTVTLHNSHSSLDFDEDKYRRRSIMKNFAKLFRSYKLISRGMNPILKWIILVLFGSLSLFIFFHFLLKLGREMADQEPLLDPNLNPNLNSEP